MKFELLRPCQHCPFRTDVKNFLHPGRRKEIAESITTFQQTFSCHKTNLSDDEGDTIETKDTQHCAGALIFLENLGLPNQMMRIAERLGMYDRFKLDMTSPVFSTIKKFINHK